ncbi:unnamed protein product, partial [marine sediment metagenome]
IPLAFIVQRSNLLCLLIIIKSALAFANLIFPDNEFKDFIMVKKEK